MSQLKHYTASDIERYHSGQLSAAEMHALEKAALDDPFLADALEGYAITAAPEKELETLQQKLQLRIAKDEKRTGVFFMRSSWMRIAALFILIAGGGWLVFQTFSGDVVAKKEVATSQEVKKPEMTSSQPANMDSVVMQGESTNNEVVVSNNVPQLQTAPEQNDMAVNKPASESLAPLPSAPSAPSTPVQSETAIQRLDAADAYMLRQQTDTLLKGNNVASMKEADKLTLRGSDTIKNMHIVLVPTGEEPETVVVNQATSFLKRRQNAVVIDSLEPAEGWMRYDDYIANNLKMPNELKTKPSNGVVELSFEVNKDGEPVNITVVKSLCEKCDEEAIRLLKEGPKWKKNKKKGKVKIKF